MRLMKFCDFVIEGSFSLLFFLTPLILTPWNYELFEYNKMMFVYFMTIIIVGAWLLKMVLAKKILLQRTPLDLALLLFLLSQVISTFISIDPHVSLFGYYSRFNGGLLSTLSYLALYYAFVTNIKFVELNKLVKFGLAAGLVVSLYGIAEHFGIDKNLWVQDVQNRVFSTLGQPNWLAAYLAILIPLTFVIPGLTGNPDLLAGSRKTWIPAFAGMTLRRHFLLPIIYYLCLLFTKSRSGILGLGTGLITFIIIIKRLRFFLRPLFFLFSFFIFLSVLIGTPFTPSLSQIISRSTAYPLRPTPSAASPSGPALETGGTESFIIRRFVWKAAWEIAKHYPLFGSGVETFAFSFYQFKPVAHNLTSEWDFLYNKAHNEYLNYAATTGFVGLGTYLLMIGWFLIWSSRKMWEMRNEKLEIEMGGGKIRNSLQKISLHNPASHLPLLISLLAAYISILVTNFFGFSVVVTSLYFYLIPAMIIISVIPAQAGIQAIREKTGSPIRSGMTTMQILLFSFILLSTFYFLLSTVKFWIADTLFNSAYQLSHAGYYQRSFSVFKSAIYLNPNEPLYHDEFSYDNAMLAVSASEQKDATLAGQLAKNSLLENQKALKISPQNVNFWKTRTKILYSLGLDKEAITSLQTAISLSPTDPKLVYNLALLQGKIGKSEEAIQTLEKAVKLKTNYQDARYALALFYHEAKQNNEAISQLQYILKNISPTDTAIKEKLKEWQP